MLPKVHISRVTTFRANLLDDDLFLSLWYVFPWRFEWLDEFVLVGGAAAGDEALWRARLVVGVGEQHQQPVGAREGAGARDHLAAALHQRAPQRLRRVLHVVVDAARLRTALRGVLYVQAVPESDSLWFVAVFQVHVDWNVDGRATGFLDFVRRLLDYCGNITKLLVVR